MAKAAPITSESASFFSTVGISPQDWKIAGGPAVHLIVRYNQMVRLAKWYKTKVIRLRRVGETSAYRRRNALIISQKNRKALFCHAAASWQTSRCLVNNIAGAIESAEMKNPANWAGFLAVPTYIIRYRFARYALIGRFLPKLQGR